MTSITYFTIFLTLLISLSHAQSFKEKQLQFARVKEAHRLKEGAVKSILQKEGLDQRSLQLFIRAFKSEEVLEVWGRDAVSEKFKLLVTYSFCTTSGILGPKRKEGDLQIPEGIYHINHFNPQSNFHLSLGINYPNGSDKILSDKKKPGGSIYIHGDCVTIGCIPITDDKIEELYLLATEARNSGQEKIPVHIFPARLTPGTPESLAIQHPQHAEFWKNLQVIFADFESTKRLKPVRVTSKGHYSF